MNRYKEEVVTEEMNALAGTIQRLSLDYKRQFASANGDRPIVSIDFSQGGIFMVGKWSDANEIKMLIESCELGL